MVTILGLSLYSYLYLKLEKCCAFLTISYVFSSTKSKNRRAEQVLLGSGGRGVGRCPKECIYM
jgi:hypothetical protein